MSPQQVKLARKLSSYWSASPDANNIIIIRIVVFYIADAVFTFDL